MVCARGEGLAVSQFCAFKSVRKGIEEGERDCPLSIYHMHIHTGAISITIEYVNTFIIDFVTVNFISINSLYFCLFILFALECVCVENFYLINGNKVEKK